MLYIDKKNDGGPEVLCIKEGNTPKVGVDEVLIKVAAAGVNRPDLMQRQGTYPPPSGASTILGLEVAGEIVSLGSDVTEWNIGDRICALTNGGGYAEYVNVPSGQCLPLPIGLDMESAAALPEAMFTVWSNVFDRAGLSAGERFLVHGGSSGIGTTAIQMAKSMGAWVATTAGTVEKCKVCEDLGADIAVLYPVKDFVKEVKASTSGYGVDVILDMVGGDYVNRNIKLAAKDGRIVSIAFLQGSKVEMNLIQMLLKRLTLTGSTLRARSSKYKAALAKQLIEAIWPVIEKGKILPQISEVFALKEAAEAHRLMESGKHIGKIILTV